MNPVLKKELDLDSSTLEDVDLVISIGGDSTYLRSAGLIGNMKTPLLGINSDPTRRTGFLTNTGID